MINLWAFTFILINLYGTLGNCFMEIIKLHGTNSKLYELVGPLVMSPAILRQNNNYPFKTSFKYTWYIALDEGTVCGFMPVKMTETDNYMIDNYYVRGDDATVLKALLAATIEGSSGPSELWATVHKRHIKLFAQNGFRSKIEWKNYDKMLYCLKEDTYGQT